ncbi:hypothetical protein WDU94_003821 [Cyamophila willieti]
MFKSAYQRSVHNVDRLTARPWWSLQETTYEPFFTQLEKNWKKIRDEALAILKMKNKTVGGFQDEAETLVQVGDWKQFDLFVRGKAKTLVQVGDWKQFDLFVRGKAKTLVQVGDWKQFDLFVRGKA